MSASLQVAEDHRVGTAFGAEAIRRIVTGVLLVVTAALVLAPVIAVTYGAFRTRPPGAPRAEFTLMKMEQAWIGLFTGDWTQIPTLNTILLAVPVTIGATALGVLLAWSVTRTDMPGRRTLEILFLVPLLYSPLVSASSDGRSSPIRSPGC